jgi:hypothetical protein
MNQVSINPIYKSNSGVCLSICGDKQGRAGARQGRAGQGGQAAAAGAGRGAISIKEILGENRGTCI